MKAFFAALGRFLTGLRVWMVNLLTLALVVYLVVMVGLFVSNRPEPVDPQGRVLLIAPEALVLEQKSYPTELGFPPRLPDEQLQVRDLLRVIETASSDQRLAGVLIDFSETAFAGPTTLFNIERALRELRERADVPVIAYSQRMDPAAYLLASAADELYVHPAGAVDISGLGGYRNYLREALDKLHIEIHNYSQGDYKSAVEGLTRDSMSDADREQTEALYAPIWSEFRARVAANRGIDPAPLDAFISGHPVVLPPEGHYANIDAARELGLITGAYTFPEFRAQMIERFGRDADSEAETYPVITAQRYLADLPGEPASEAEAQVAVVTVEGTIQEGELAPGVAGSNQLAGLIRRAYEDDATRALVVRVNSPGGSIMGSEMIRDELVRARTRGLPVVISMGDVAASGGVWVSTASDRVFAEPTTITGSIGVAIAVPTVERSLERLGIRFDGVTTTEYAGWSPVLSVDEQLDAVFARWADDAYRRFIEVVAQSRNRSVEEIRSIAGGRVWIGGRAAELGLVDELGGIEQAVEAAAGLAGLDDYRVEHVVQPPSTAFRLLEAFAVGMGREFLSSRPTVLQRADRLIALLEGVVAPRVTVLCTQCQLPLH
jgi:protease-4